MKRIALLLFFIACLFMPALAQVDIEFGKVEWCKAGRFIDFKLMQSEKALFSIDFTLLPIDTDFRPKQPSKAWYLIDFFHF